VRHSEDSDKTTADWPIQATTA